MCIHLGDIKLEFCGETAVSNFTIMSEENGRVQKLFVWIDKQIVSIRYITFDIDPERSNHVKISIAFYVRGIHILQGRSL